MTKLALSALVAASVSVLALSPAAAEEFSAQISYSDLKLNTPAGAETLAKRVSSVCERPDIRNLRAVSAWRDCQDTALNSAMEQLNVKGVAFDSAAFLGG